MGLELIPIQMYNYIIYYRLYVIAVSSSKKQIFALDALIFRKAPLPSS